MPDKLTSDHPDSPIAGMPKPKPVHPLAQRPQEEAEQAGATPRQSIKLTTYPRPKKSYLTWGLIALNLLIFVFTSNKLQITLPIVRDFANQPLAVLEHGEYWRLFTSMFLHINVPHVILNMIALYNIGSILEIVFGHKRYIAIYMLGGLTASLMSTFFQPMTGFAIGASGAVFAIFGAEAAYIWVNLHALNTYNDNAATKRLRYVLIFAGMYFAIGFIGEWSGGGLVNMDNWAHIGGFIGGAVITYMICPRYRMSINEERTELRIDDMRPFNTTVFRVVGYAAALVVALVVAGLIR